VAISDFLTAMPEKRLAIILTLEQLTHVQREIHVQLILARPDKLVN
jgi:hypothetical protein